MVVTKTRDLTEGRRDHVLGEEAKEGLVKMTEAGEEKEGKEGASAEHMIGWWKEIEKLISMEKVNRWDSWNGIN